MAEPTPIIQVKELSSAFEDDLLLDHVSFDVLRGEILAILGGSGSGKSTLIKHMIGLLSPATGQVLYGDHDLLTAAGKERTEILRRIGVMYQSGALFGSLTLIENVRVPLEEFTDLPQEAMNLVAQMKLSLVGLAGFENYMPAEISGGMRKRAAIARAMVLDPEILYLDEPSAGLDPITSAELDQLILRIRSSLGITFVIVTHEIPSILTIADRALMIDKRVRRIVASGPPRELQNHPTNEWVRRFFHREVERSGVP